MKRLRVYVVMRPRYECPLRTAFVAGLRRHGVYVEAGREPLGRFGMVVLWGVRAVAVIEEQKRKGAEICILERGYIGDRQKWTSVSFGGGLNGRGVFRGVQSDPARFERMHGDLLKPWQTGRGFALLIGQVPNDMSLAPVRGSLAGWYGRIAEELRGRGHDVRFRPHPGSIGRGINEVVPGAQRISGSLHATLSRAAFAVTFNSNAAVDAVLAGVPTVTLDPGSMAYDVTSHDLAAPVWRPDRQQWAAELAWKQWSLEEMASGDCWAAVGRA